MHVLQFLKWGQAAPPGGRLKFSKNKEFDCSDSDMRGRGLRRYCEAEFNEILYNGSIEGLVNAHS